MSFAAIIALEDGTILEGNGFGIETIEVGEIVFNTSMTGYQEIITDPSYKDQIITFTHPHIGNTGINDEDNESDMIHASGIVINELCDEPSNWRATVNLETFLKKNNKMGIAGIDTRSLTSLLREKGSLKACIASKEKLSNEEAINKAKEFSGLKGLDLAKVVSTTNSYKWNEGIWPDYIKNESKYKIVAIDFGIKKNILRLLSESFGEIQVVNAESSFDEIMQHNPDGVFLSNGPGDPEPCIYAIENIRKLLELKIPIFGICLGHQLLSLAANASTYKMKFGHHGANHPVQDLDSSEVFITSQNHGFAVDQDSLPKSIRPTHISLFDNSLQGIELTDSPAFSFQGHPEASPGPQEIQLLFNKFKKLVEENA